MIRFLSLIAIAAFFSSCGPSQDAHDAEEAQEQARVQQIIAVNNTLAGTYTGTLTDDSTTPASVVNISLVTISTEVFTPSASDNKMAEIPTLVGYLKESPFDEQDGGPLPAIPPGAVHDANHYWKCTQADDTKLMLVTKKKPAPPQQVCYHYTHNDERELATYGTGVYDPSSGALQFWAGSPVGQSSTNPVIGNAGLLLTVSGKHIEGFYIAPMGGHEQISLDFQP